MKHIHTAYRLVTVMLTTTFVDEFVMVTVLRCWCQNHYISDFFRCAQFESVTEISKLSPTGSVANIDKGENRNLSTDHSRDSNLRSDRYGVRTTKLCFYPYDAEFGHF